MLALLSSAAEPLTIALYAIESFAHNLASAIFFRRYSFLAAILVRLGHYMVWHVIYENFFA